MKPIRILTILGLLFAFTVPMEAKNNNRNRRAIEQAKKKKIEKEKMRKERKNAHEKLKDYMEGLDTNKDGSLSKDEFLAKESNKAAAELTFNQHNKNKDRFLSKKEIQDMLGQ